MKKPPMQYQGQQQVRQPQRQTFLNRTIIPTKDIDPLLISTLLLKVSTDEINILELGNFILTNGITTNDMLNEDGESILHLIISNNNISSRKKLEIIKYLKANFTLLSSYDKNGRTPLHLAVQNQLIDIVKELIDSGHHVNALDNFYKSPLHYAVIGKNIETPTKIDKKLIPEKKTKIKSDLLKELSDNLVRYMDKDEKIKMFFNNQYSTVYNSKFMFNKEITDIIQSTDIINKIVGIISNPQLTTEMKQKQIFEKTSECNKNVKSILTTKLQNIKKEIRLESNIENGWGPNNLNVNNILENKSYTEFNIKLDSKLTSHINEIGSITQDINSDLLDYYKNINDSIRSIMNITNLLMFMSKFYKQLCYLEDPVNLRNKYYNNIDELLIDDSIIRDILYDPTTHPLNDSHIYDPRLNFNVKYNLVTNQIETGTDLYTGINFANTALQPKDESRIINALNSLVNDPKLMTFRNDVDNIFRGGQTTNLPGGDIRTDLIDNLFRSPPTNPSYYLTKKLHILNNFIYKTELDMTNIHILQLITLLKNNPTDMNIINHLSELNIHIYNLSNIIPKIFIEYEKILDVFKNIKQKLYTGRDIVKLIPKIGGTAHNLSIFHTECIGLIDKMNKDIDKKLSEFNIKMFNSIRKYHGIYNKIVDYVNNIHAINYTKIYFNQFNEANLFTDKTDTINNVFYLPINNDNNYFKSYTDLINFINNKNDEVNEKQNKIKLINKFLLQFNSKNLNVYINNANPMSKTNGKNGIINGILTQINNLDISLNEITIKHDDNYIDEYNDINYDVSDSTTKLGQLEILQLTPPTHNFLKKHQSFPIIAKMIDEFYNIQKYIIIRYILSIIYIYILNPIPAVPDVSLVDDINNLKISIDKLKNSIQESINNNPDDISMLLITLGKIIDKIYNVNLDNMINNTTNDFGYRYYRNTIEKISPSELTPYRIINITEMNKLNIDEKYFDDIKKSIYKLFKENQKLELFNYVENEFVKEFKDKNIFKISSNTIGDNPNELYYKFNKDIIELLIKHGGDINSKDKDGNTPLMIALIQNNTNLIDYILNNQQYQNISVFSKKSKNRMGIRPFDICVKSLKVVIDNYSIQINDETIKNITKEINDKISKLTKIKHTMRFNNILLKLTMYLLNHNFYSLLNNYKYQKDETFHNILFNSITTEITSLPLLNFLDKIKVSYHKPISTLMENEFKSSIESVDNIDKLRKQKDLLNEELIKINNIPLANRNKYRADEIQDQINEITMEISKLVPTPTHLQDEINDITNQQEQNYNLNQNDRTILIANMNIIITKDILKMYNEIIEKIHAQNKDDYRTYMSLWEKLFETDTANDSTQIITRIMDNINNLLKECVNCKNIQNFDINKFNTIETGINLCTNYVNDYFDLPFVFDGDNYVLNKIIDIFVHIIRNTIMVNLYHIIEKLLRVEIVNKIQRLSNQPQIDYEKELDEKVKKITESTINNVNIKTYLFDVLPEKLVKSVLNLYENDDDDDKKTNIITLFEFINKILEANTIIQINKDNSKIITTLDAHVYPYFKEYIDIVINNMKKFTDGYLSMLLDLSSKLSLFRHIVNKAYKEKY